MSRRSEFRIIKCAVKLLAVKTGDSIFWDRDLAGLGVHVLATGSGPVDINSTRCLLS